MKSFLLSLSSILALHTLSAQTFEQISIGAGYSQQLFYDLETNEGLSINDSDWDLMFTAFGLQDAGIHVNEASASTFSAPAPTVEFFLTDAEDFTSVTSYDSSYVRLYNNELNWSFGGLNIGVSPSDPFNYGWGVYDPATRQVVGNKIFLVKLRSNDFKKFMIESLAGTTYNIKYANLDGTDEQTASIDKANFTNGFALFSFENGVLEEKVPQGFDLLYTRYITPLIDPSTSDTLYYTVTGILSGLGVEVAKISGTDPASVTAETSAEYLSNLDAIGFDWKDFSFTSGWNLPDDLSYILKTAENKLYKLVFIDFEGSSTGTATFELTDLGILANLEHPNSTFESFAVFPNPVQNDLNITYSLKQPQAEVYLNLYNNLGQLVWTIKTNGNTGLNARHFDLPDLPSGNYYLNIQAGSYKVTQKVNVY